MTTNGAAAKKPIRPFAKCYVDTVLHHPLMRSSRFAHLVCILSALANRSDQRRKLYYRGRVVLLETNQVAITKPDIKARMTSPIQRERPPSDQEIRTLISLGKKHRFWTQNSNQRLMLFTLHIPITYPGDWLELQPDVQHSGNQPPTNLQPRDRDDSDVREDSDPLFTGYSELDSDSQTPDSAEKSARSGGDFDQLPPWSDLDLQRSLATWFEPDPEPQLPATTNGANGHATPAPSPAVIEREFSAWWLLWSLPGTKRGRGAALRKYAQARRRGVPAEALAAGVARYMAWCAARGDPPSLIKHPATWLNAGCWDDDLPDPEADRAARRQREQPEWQVDRYAGFLAQANEEARRKIDAGGDPWQGGDVVPLRRRDDGGGW